MNAGLINFVTLAGSFKIGTAHMSGNSTSLATLLLISDFERFTLVLSIIFLYLFGGFISGFMITDSKFTMSNAYDKVLLLQSLSTLVAFVLLNDSHYAGELFAAFSCGLQNGIFYILLDTMTR